MDKISPESSEIKAPEIWKDVFHHCEKHRNPAPMSHCWIKPICQGGAGKEAVELVNRSRKLIIIIIFFFGFFRLSSLLVFCLWLHNLLFSSISAGGSDVMLLKHLQVTQN